MNADRANGERQLLPAQRLFELPFVTMVAAIAVYLLALLGGIMIDSAVPAGKPADLVLRSSIPLVLAISAYKLVIAQLGSCPRDDLRLAGSATDLGKGLFLGFVLFSLIVGFAGILGVYTIVGTGNAPAILVPLVTSAITPAFTEEILFRGILFRWIEQSAGSWAALVLTSTLFGLAHILNPGATWFSSVAIAVEGGLLLGGVYMLTRNLWMVVGLHAAWNFAQGPIFGIPVSGGHVSGLLNARLSGPNLLSGGSFGLEASLIAVVVGGSAGILFIWLAIRRGELVRPQARYRKRPDSTEASFVAGLKIKENYRDRRRRSHEPSRSTQVLQASDE